MIKNDEWNWDKVLGKPTQKQDQDWSLPQPKQDQNFSLPEPRPVVSEKAKAENWDNFLTDALIGTKDVEQQTSSQVTDSSWNLPQMDPAIEALYKPYIDVLQEYMFHGTPEKSQFFNNDPNTGYKVHLNVLPENVVAVSNFLKTHGFNHKYLNGGEIESGKVFTVYLGSKEATERYVKEIYEGVGNLLEIPKAHGEIEYAPRIVGRFVGGKQYFRQYGRDGISALYDLPTYHPENTPERAKKKALEEYGEYFGGGVTPYQP